MSRNLTDALSKLFIKLGGKTSDSKENKGPIDYIDDITDIVEPGGGGDSDIFKVTLTFDPSTGTPTTDKTFEEAVSALNSGKIVAFFDPMTGLHIPQFVYDGNPDNSKFELYNVVPNTSGDGQTYFNITIMYWNKDGSLTSSDVIRFDADSVG